MDNKIKHLEFIQNLINRMNKNSFLLKEWAVIMVSGLITLLVTRINEIHLVWVAFIPLIPFWVLDGFFVATENKYRALYKEVAGKKEDEIDFSLDVDKFKGRDFFWFYNIFSKTLWIFYGLLIVVTSVVIGLAHLIG